MRFITVSIYVFSLIIILCYFIFFLLYSIKLHPPLLYTHLSPLISSTPTFPLYSPLQPQYLNTQVEPESQAVRAVQAEQTQYELNIRAANMVCVYSVYLVINIVVLFQHNHIDTVLMLSNRSI